LWGRGNAKGHSLHGSEMTCGTRSWNSLHGC